MNAEIDEAFDALHHAETLDEKRAAIIKLQSMGVMDPDVEVDDIVKGCDEQEAIEQAEYNRAADIAHEMIKGWALRVLEANADPLDAAYELWAHFTEILTYSGYSACSLGEAAHDIQARNQKKDDDEPEVTVQ